jgi:hypothetical protein
MHCIIYLLFFWVLKVSSLYSESEVADNNLQKDASTSIQQYHDVGVVNFFENKFLDAIDNFNKVLEKNIYFDQSLVGLIASSLWGRALSYACLGQHMEASYDLILFDAFLNNPCLCANISQKPPKPNPPKVRYSNPNEQLTPGECLERVRGTVFKLEELLHRYFRRGTPNYKQFMDRVKTLAEQAADCCQEVVMPSTNWTNCLYRLLEAFEAWKKAPPTNPYSYND